MGLTNGVINDDEWIRMEVIYLLSMLLLPDCSHMSSEVLTKHPSFYLETF